MSDQAIALLFFPAAYAFAGLLVGFSLWRERRRQSRCDHDSQLCDAGMTKRCVKCGRRTA